MDACPVEIEHLTHFTDMNRQLTEQGDVDPNVQDVYRRGRPSASGLDPEAVHEKVMRQGNTFGESARSRPDWTEELDFAVPDARDRPVDVLWYVGDYLSYDDHNQEIAKALARVLEACEFETIVCTDPHSYNTFTNEYPEIDFEEFADDPMLEAPIEGH